MLSASVLLASARVLMTSFTGLAGMVLHGSARFRMQNCSEQSCVVPSARNLSQQSCVLPRVRIHDWCFRHAYRGRPCVACIPTRCHCFTQQTTLSSFALRTERTNKGTVANNASKNTQSSIRTRGTSKSEDAHFSKGLPVAAVAASATGLSRSRTGPNRIPVSVVGEHVAPPPLAPTARGTLSSSSSSTWQVTQWRCEDVRLGSSSMPLPSKLFRLVLLDNDVDAL